MARDNVSVPGRLLLRSFQQCEKEAQWHPSKQGIYSGDKWWPQFFCELSYKLGTGFSQLYSVFHHVHMAISETHIIYFLVLLTYQYRSD